MRQATAGSALLAASVTGAMVNLWARDAFPARWGGPNIGGGMLQLLFYAGALTGAVLIVTSLVRRRRDRGA
jgi:hypothetical protein